MKIFCFFFYILIIHNKKTRNRKPNGMENNTRHGCISKNKKKNTKICRKLWEMKDSQRTFFIYFIIFFTQR